MPIEGWPPPLMKESDWPRLSETLAHREPGRCAECGHEEAPETARSRMPLHTVWQECDRDDRPEPRYVELCRICSAKLIEPHPRLYRALNPHTPAPGAMPICRDCIHRDGTRCVCPAAKYNGGPGIEIIGPKPTMVHFLRSGKGARSGWEPLYPGPSTECTGKA